VKAVIVYDQWYTHSATWPDPQWLVTIIDWFYYYSVDTVLTITIIIIGSIDYLLLLPDDLKNDWLPMTLLFCALVPNSDGSDC